MNDFTLLLQDRFRYVNISKSEKYLLSAKASKISVYDFREKKKLFEIRSPNIRMALFSGNEDFILILKTCSIDFFRHRTGNRPDTPDGNGKDVPDLCRRQRALLCI